MQSSPKPPLTATHRSNACGRYYRVTNEEYADYFISGKWFQSSVTNLEIQATERRKYARLFHTGFALKIANAFQWTIGSAYRVKEVKIY